MTNCFAASSENMFSKEKSNFAGLKKEKNYYLKDRKSHLSNGDRTIIKKDRVFLSAEWFLLVEEYVAVFGQSAIVVLSNWNAHRT